MPDEIVIPVPGESTPKKKEEVRAMDDTISLVLNQAFAKSHQVGLQAADRHSAGNDNVAEQSRLGYLESKAQVGTREAAAMQRMDDNKLAQNILAQRAAANQPEAPK